jgi:hypothetical protein
MSGVKYPSEGKFFWLKGQIFNIEKDYAEENQTLGKTTSQMEKQVHRLHHNLRSQELEQQLVLTREHERFGKLQD